MTMDHSSLQGTIERDGASADSMDHIPRMPAGDRTSATPVLIEERNALRKAHNAEIDAKQKAILRERDEASRPCREKLNVLETQQNQLHAAAATAVAEAGGVYDSNEPSESCVLRHEPATLNAVAAKLKLPTRAEADTHLPVALSWVLTVIVGIAVGISIGILAHVLHADTLTRQPLLTLFFALLGISVSIALKYAVRSAWFLAIRDYFVPTSVAKWASMIALATAFTTGLFVSDLVVERGGLLVIQSLLHSTAMLAGGSRSGDNFWENVAYWFAAAVFTLGYLLCAGYEGAIAGEQAAVHNRLVLQQQEDYKQADAGVRSDPKIQAALLAIAVVKDGLRQIAREETRLEAIESPFDAKIAALEAQRLGRETGATFGGAPPAKLA